MARSPSRSPSSPTILLALLASLAAGHPDALPTAAADSDSSPGALYSFHALGSGTTIALDGTFAVVGDPDAATVVVLRREGTTWRVDARLAPPEARNGSRFGEAVDVHRDRLVVGAPGEAAAYVYKRERGAWRLKDQLHSNPVYGTFGAEVDPDRDVLVVVATRVPPFDHGSVHVVVRSTAGWREETAFPLPPGRDTGRDVSLAGDLIAVAAPDDRAAGGTGGAVHLYRRTPLGVQVYPPIRDGVGVGALFGWAVALDGVCLAVGSPIGANGDRDGGGVYVYDVRDPHGPRFLRAHRAEEPRRGDLFGSALAASSGAIVVASVASGRVVPYVLADPARADGYPVVGGNLSRPYRYPASAAVAGDVVGVASAGALVAFPDADRDRLSDREERTVWRTDPRDADTDGDLWADGHEVDCGSSPTSPASTGVRCGPPSAAPFPLPLPVGVSRSAPAPGAEEPTAARPERT